MEATLAKKKPRPKQVVFDGAKLREHRLGAGLTQIELGEAAELYHGDISKYESGSMEPTLAVAARLALALNVQVNELLKPIQLKPRQGDTPPSATE